MTWKPHVTVAAVAEHRGQFLLVEELVSDSLVINQPAGHLEPGETLLQAVTRETLEETAWQFEPEALSGIYLWTQPDNGRTFLRFAFCGRCLHHYAERKLDDGIMRTLWLPREHIAVRQAELRSPMVLRCVDDYLAGQRFPLEMIDHLDLTELTARASGSDTIAP